MLGLLLCVCEGVCVCEDVCVREDVCVLYECVMCMCVCVCEGVSVRGVSYQEGRPVCLQVAQ